MSKKNVFKVAGFVGTLGAGAALVASAAAGTGAWFTDSENGSLAASSGNLSVNLISGTRNMQFQNLMPGDYKTQSVTYQVQQSSGKSDVWLVLNPQDPAVLALTGDNGNSLYPAGGLGRYGHFALSSNGSTVFQSNNLTHAPSGGTECPVNAYGHGGSAQQATSPTDTPPYCGVPYAIRLASDLSSGATGTMTLEFGLTGRQTQQNQTEFNGSVPFQIVATQAGHRPDAGNF